MKKPDRFERAAGNTVQQLMGCEAFELTAASTEMVKGAERIVAKLLRAEHHAVVRLVKGMLKKHEGVMLTMAGAAYDAALKQLLAALAARRMT